MQVEIGYQELIKNADGATVSSWVTITSVSIKGGTHESLSRSDAYKGAYTNGLKKCLGFLGVGADAYLGTVDEENRPLPEEVRGEPPGVSREEADRTKEKAEALETLRQRVTELGLEAKEITKVIHEVTGKGNSRELTAEEVRAVTAALGYMQTEDDCEGTEEGLTCECGAKITASVKSFSEREFGRSLCMKCQNRERERKGVAANEA